jgi:DNA/RNA-binding domain of Phe-tRNA-synthetase-like protein
MLVAGTDVAFGYDCARDAGEEEGEGAMYFQHADGIWRDFPELVAGVIHARGISAVPATPPDLAPYLATADARLAGGMESDLPEIQAWRRAFSRMGLKPTQYRCAAESLLRRYRKEGALPAISPLIDLYNAVSLAFATPVAVFDLARVTDYLEVRYANGDEQFVTLSGEIEEPPAGEVIFADGGGQAHARRWSHRQSGSSGVSETTRDILIVSEAHHPTAFADMERLITALSGELQTHWGVTPRSAILTADTRRFE